METSMKHFSFIRARDPSILAYNRPLLDPSVRKCINSEFLEDSEESDLLSDEKSTKQEQIHVFLRIKPCDNLKESYEVIDSKTLLCRVPDGSQASRSMRDGHTILKKFTFSKIYTPDKKQNEIFNDLVKDNLIEFINGKNCTVFAYGASGSGKTFTMLGTTVQPGIIPRSLEYVFRTLPPLPEFPTIKPLSCSGQAIILDKNESKQEKEIMSHISKYFSNSDRNMHIKTYKAMQQRLSSELAGTIIQELLDASIGIWVTFAEIYNEYVYDLLESEKPRGQSRTKLRLGQDENGNTFIKNLKAVYVSSGLEAYKVLQYGKQNLNYASTSLNSHSSRSHCIFTIKIVQANTDCSEVQISQFNFCDLAGSERTKLSHSVGERLKESNNINTSLHVLGRCIKSMKDSSKHKDIKLVPFRESKLTRLFQSAMSGRESITMIVNMNPNKNMFDESQHVLNFSAIAQDVTIEVHKKAIKVQVKNRFSEYIQSGGDTKLPKIEEDDEVSEIAYLREMVVSLSQQLETQKQKEEAERTELNTKLSKIIQEKDKYWLNRLDSQKADFEDYYENKIQSVENYYEKIVVEQAAKRPRSTDSNDCKECNILQTDLTAKTRAHQKLRKLFDDVQEQNCQLQAENTRLSFENQVNKTKIQELENIEAEKNKRISNLEVILSDGKLCYEQLEKEKQETEEKLNTKICECVSLQKEVLCLNSLLSEYREANIEQTEYVEGLEEDLENLKNK